MADFNAGGKPMSADDLFAWLLPLLKGKAHGMSEEGLAGRCEALLEGIEDYPSRCFTRETRKELRRTLGDFVPTDKELIKAVDAIDQANRTAASRCMKLIDIAAKPIKSDDAEEPWHQRGDFKWTPDDARRHGERLAAKQAAERAADLKRLAELKELPPMPIRQGGESDDMWLARLKEWRGQCGKAPDRLLGTGPDLKGEDDKRRSGVSGPVQLADAYRAKQLEPADG
jgi:hypothetical protein